jgi:hypothetical protein
MVTDCDVHKKAKVQMARAEMNLFNVVGDLVFAKAHNPEEEGPDPRPALAEYRVAMEQCNRLKVNYDYLPVVMQYAELLTKNRECLRCP